MSFDIKFEPMPATQVRVVPLAYVQQMAVDSGNPNANASDIAGVTIPIIGVDLREMHFQTRQGNGGEEFRFERGPLKLTQRYEILMVDAYSECEQRIWLEHEQRHVGDYERLKRPLKRKILAHPELVSFYVDRDWFLREMFEFLQKKTREIVGDLFYDLTTAASAKRDSRREYEHVRREVRQQCSSGHRQPTSGAGTARPTRGRPAGRSR